MDLRATLFPILGAALILAYQDMYEVIQERVDRDYVDNSLMHFTCGVYKSNRTTNALNLTAKMIYTLMDKDMTFVTGYKWLSNEYRLDIIQFQDTIKNIMNFKYFDLNRLFHNYSSPPFIWPLKPGVTYHMFNWIPDSTDFPPGIPEGRWKLQINVTKADGTPIIIFSWYFKIQYLIKKFEVRTLKPRTHRH